MGEWGFHKFDFSNGGMGVDQFHWASGKSSGVLISYLFFLVYKFSSSFSHGGMGVPHFSLVKGDEYFSMTDELSQIMRNAPKVGRSTTEIHGNNRVSVLGSGCRIRNQKIS